MPHISIVVVEVTWEFRMSKNIEFHQKQPVVVLYQPMCQKKQNSFKRHREKILVCACFGFCSKIYAIVRGELQFFSATVLSKRNQKINPQ